MIVVRQDGDTGRREYVHYSSSAVLLPRTCCSTEGVLDLLLISIVDFILTDDSCNRRSHSALISFFQFIELLMVEYMAFLIRRFFHPI
jgi:hypothetical protein